MRQFRLAMSIMMVAMAAVGCGRKEADRTATKVLRPDEVKISLGADTPAPNVAEAATPPAAEPKAP